jgi:hypothetical protein
MATLEVHHLQFRIHEAADSDNVLLEQLDDDDELFMSVEEV